MKVCIKCHKEKPDNCFAISKWKYPKDGLQNTCKQCNKIYRELNKEKILKYKREYRIKNRTLLAKKQHEYLKQNPLNKEQYQRKLISTKNCQRKARTIPKNKINYSMSKSIWFSLKKNKAYRSWLSLVPYTLDELIKHLKKTIPIGYKWQDLLDGKLHLDHKIPKSVFNFSKPEDIDFKRCWALSNLQLLPANENLRKHAKLTKPFQPSLSLTILP